MAQRQTWTQKDYQREKKHYHRHKLMTKVVDSIIASGLFYKDIAKKAGVAPSTITRWVTSETRNGKIDTIMSVLGALNMEMVLVARGERSSGQSSEKKRGKVPRSEMGGTRRA